MTQTRNFSLVLALFLVLSLTAAPRAKAESIGDSAMIVGLSAIAGAIFGASTLPFYDESGEHTKNIFYGAAIGAVIGVGVAAYSGVKDGPGFDDARLKPTPASQLSLNDSPEFRLRSERSTAQLKPAPFAAGTTLAWSPLGTVRF